MARGDAQRLRTFQRQTEGYERALLRRIRELVNKNRNTLTRLALENDWDEFHNTVIGFQEELKRTLAVMYEASGERTVEELR